MAIRYELIVFYCLGWTPGDAQRRFGVSRGLAYRYYHRYREGLRACGTNQRRLSQQMFEAIEKKRPDIVFVPFVMYHRS